MRKFFLIIPTVALVVFLLIFSCSPSIDALKEQACSALENGDLDSAKENFQQVLNSNPDDPNANAGMAIIETYKAISEIGSTANDVSDYAGAISSLSDTFKASSSPSRSLKAIALAVLRGKSTKIGDFLHAISGAQENLEGIIPKLERVVSFAEKALKREITLKLYLNKFDWDKDGKKGEPGPLKFKVIDPNTGAVTGTFTMTDVYKENVIINGGGIVLVDESGGDGVLDFGYLTRKRDNPVFSQDDFITIDKGEMFAIKTLAEALLSILHLATTYDFNLPDGLVENLDSDPSSSTIIEWLDGNENGNGNKVIEPDEWQNLDPFLEFRVNGADHLRKTLENAESAVRDFKELLVHIKSDTTGEEEHNITSVDFVPLPDDFDDFTSELDTIAANLKDTPITLDDGTKIKLYLLRENPENFQDLKEFFPELDTETGDATPPKDDTFGGLIER